MLICGGIGGGAQAALAEAGIALYAGAQGNTDEAVEAYLRENWFLPGLIAIIITARDTAVAIMEKVIPAAGGCGDSCGNGCDAQPCADRTECGKDLPYSLSWNFQ